MRRTVLFIVIAAILVLMTCGVASAATCVINGGAAYTNNPVVNVSYVPGVTDLVYRISNRTSFSDAKWSPIQSPGTVSGWSLLDFTRSGKKTVYMQFATDPTADPSTDPTACQDSIILDRNAPRIYAARVSVRRGHVCALPFLMRDGTSPRCKAKVTITTRGGTVKWSHTGSYMATNRWWQYRYTCKLRKGTYLIKVTCWDLAKNVAGVRQGATLTVR
jgi:hypothetical protein